MEAKRTRFIIMRPHLGFLNRCISPVGLFTSESTEMERPVQACEKIYQKFPMSPKEKSVKEETV
jgi:hypothetical protein